VEDTDVDLDSDMNLNDSIGEFVLSSWDDHGPNVPIIGPRRHYTGARNVATVKDGDPIYMFKLRCFLTKVFMLKQ
jgi:hypothetical protein